MDIYDYLKLDHDHVEKLFKQFEKSERTERQIQIMIFLAQELLVHAKSEQETFYKALQRYPDTCSEALHGKKEHTDIEEQINLILESKNTTSTEWHKKVEKLKELVTHHVKEEEGEIFKKAKEVLSEQESYALKEQMHYLKQNLLRRLEKIEKLTVLELN